MSAFDEEVLEKKLFALKDTHESISALSAWCLEHPQHHKKIVSVWLQVLKKVKIEQRLTLFHLANDVIQYSKRKGYNFVESWGTALQKATTMVRDDKVKNKILRLFKIWDERSIYDEAFLVDLSGLLSSRKPAQSQPEAQDFQPSVLINKIRSCKSLEDDTDMKRKIVNESHLSLNDAEALHSSLKDRRHGADLEQELEEGVEKMNAFIAALKSEIKDRTSLIELLDLSDAFYENQRGEAKIVCNAYRNFSKRVDNLKKKLDELANTLPSPMPSPDVNAPSPSPESDIDLPEDSLPGKYSAASSFIGSLVMPENMQLSKTSEELYSSRRNSKDSPPRKLGYKPPTPPRNFKRKSSPKHYHSPPPPTYISSNTPTLSSSSASNYSSNSPYQPVSKPNSFTPNTSSYSVPTVTYPQSVETYSNTTSYPPSGEHYSSMMYNPEDNENSYNNPSPEPYGHDEPPRPLPLESFMNPPPPNAYDSSSRNYQTPNDPYQGKSYNAPPNPPNYSVPLPTNNEYDPSLRPFYSSSNNLTVPPLLGEDCPPPPANGLDSFLQGDNNDEPSNPNPLGGGSGFSSFMGNLNLPFDFQKGLFSETSCDTPASPPPENMLDDSTSAHIDSYFSDSSHGAEGKPIEVINRTKQPDLSEILKVISSKGGPRMDLPSSTPVTSVPPPPLPPTAMGLSDYNEDQTTHDKPWAQPPLLPPKFPTWGQDSWADTPASPPLYEKTGFSEPVEFEESDSLTLGDADTDLRALGIQGDIDHRNLISLTSSPREDAPWPNQDTDYRKLALAPKKGTQDNVESVDMEMSSEEETEKDEPQKPSPTVSFSLTPQKKNLVESPLKEKDEPVKKVLNVTLSPPPRLPEPPPLPDVNDIFPDLDSGGESDVKAKLESEITVPERIPSPPLPPLPPPPMPIQSIQQEGPGSNQGFNSNQRPRGFYNPRFNNQQRQRFPHWQNSNSNPRQRQPPMVGPRHRGGGSGAPDSFRGRPPWFRGPPRPPRYAGCINSCKAAVRAECNEGGKAMTTRQETVVPSPSLINPPLAANMQ